MAMEIDSSSVVCYRCGKPYSRRRGCFQVSYATLYKGMGYLPICRECVENLYNIYLAQCNNSKDAVRQVCRKLDLYWDEDIFNSVENKSTARTIISQYMTKVNTNRYAGRCYDNTLSNEGTLWNFNGSYKNDGNAFSLKNNFDPHTSNKSQSQDMTLEDYGISEDVAAFWGSGYPPDMLADLEQRRSYWMSKLPKDIEVDIGTEAIIRQICSLELDINRDRAAGRSVDKNVNTLNTLLGSAKLKPTQKKDETNSNIDSTPFGVWIRRWENQRPIPEPDPELQDVDGIIRYISIWFLGHLCKMLGIKNTYCKLYEDEIAKMRIERPEYDEEDDETMFNDIFGSSDLSEDKEDNIKCQE